MLQKNTELDIDPNDPFKHDCLNRKESIDDLTNLLKSTHQPFVLSVEAPWGWGKTSFIKMWKAQLDNECHPCLYFNAWSNDFADDPLVAFISEMNSLLSYVEKQEDSIELKQNLKKLQKFGGSVLRKSIPVMLRLLTQGIISEDSLEILKTTEKDIGNLIEEIAEERINAYEDSKNSISNFREELSKFANKLANNDGTGSPLIFFIDELDRCRPDYAIALLERVKHLFNVEGVVFVLSVDRQQLIASIKAIYGNDMDADGYLRRFIDLRYNLPEPSIEEFIKMLSLKYKFKDYFDERKNAGYLNRSNEENLFIRSLIDYVKQFEFSLRETEQILIEINLILRTTAINKKLVLILLNFLVCLKSYNIEIYNMFTQNDKGIDEIITIISSLFSSSANYIIDYEPLIIAYILSNYRDESISITTSLEEIVENKIQNKNPKDEIYRASRILEIMKSIRFDYFEKALSHYIDRIENIGHFLK